MLSVAGFMGGRQQSHLLSFGPAVFFDELTLHCPATKERFGTDDWDSLVLTGRVSSFGENKHGPLWGGYLTLPCIVLRTLKPDAHPVGGYVDRALYREQFKVLEEWTDTAFKFFLLADIIYLEDFAKHAQADLKNTARDFERAHQILTTGLLKNNDD